MTDEEQTTEQLRELAQTEEGPLWQSARADYAMAATLCSGAEEQRAAGYIYRADVVAADGYRMMRRAAETALMAWRLDRMKQKEEKP